MKLILSLPCFALLLHGQTVIGTAPTGSGPIGLTVAPNHKVYTANSQSNTATSYDPATGTATQIPLPGCSGPGAVGGITVNRTTGVVYVPCEYSGNVVAIDSRTDTIAATFYAGGSGVLWVVSDDAAGVLGIQSEFSWLIYFYDESTNALIGTAPTPNPEQIAVDPGTHIWYAANENNAEITIIQGPGAGQHPPPPPPPSCSGGTIHPSVSLTPSNYYPVPLSSFTLTLTIAGETCGQVTFTDGGVTIGTAIVSAGVAQFTYNIPSASHQFVAHFGGSNTRAPGISSTIWIRN